MTDKEKLNYLQSQAENLQKKMNEFSKEINNLHLQIIRMQSETDTLISKKPAEVQNPEIIVSIPQPIIQPRPDNPKETVVTRGHLQDNSTITRSGKSDIERFIGENLISKAGIIILIIGIAIGTKYSIEHELINPLTRIILGYISGCGLLILGIRLKKQYEKYSAVLVSGAIAVMYFITYAAYSFYELIPQLPAFIMMVFFTGFAVIAALNYNQQIIALIGLVGAYAVPFLLSEGSGKAGILFSYVSVINIGILIIAFRKYWQALYYSAFGLTWLIYFSWYIFSFNRESQFTVALMFVAIFFILFYGTFLAYKLYKRETYNIGDIIFLITNSFFFYGIGYDLLNKTINGHELLGLFTLLNALIHFIMSFIIYRNKLADRKLFYLLSGFVLVFITIAIPVQLDGNWVSLLWVCEASLLFWLGRTKNIPVYERLSYPLIAVAFLSLLQDWGLGYINYRSGGFTPLINIKFLSSVIFIAAFSFIYRIDKTNKVLPSSLHPSNQKLFSITIASILMLIIYYAFRLEITGYFNHAYYDSEIVINKGTATSRTFINEDLRKYKSLWVINYTLLFGTILTWVNLRIIRDGVLAYSNLILNSFAILVFLSQGLLELSGLRESYLSRHLSEYYDISTFNIWARYISYGITVVTLYSVYRYIKSDLIKTKLKVAFDFLLHISAIWIISSELINWMDLSGSSQPYKIGLSILWGVYSLFLITLGIWKRKKHLRIGAIILFGATLIKLFFYDIRQMESIAKTIIFVSLGILLLIISFLYNKYKNKIFDEPSS